MTAQEALNQALWNKLPEDIKILIEQAIVFGNLKVIYENPTPEVTRVLRRLGYHIINGIRTTYISFDL